jgi:hypothetical protein
LYVIYRYGKSTGSPMVGSSFLDTLFPGNTIGLTPTQAALLPYSRTTAAGNTPSQPGTPASVPIGQPVGVGIAVTGATTGLTVGSKVAGAGGLSLTSGLIATGIGAAAAVVAWGVIDKGWFRGGQEALYVNPNRDVFLSQFANFDYTRDASNPPGFYGCSLVLLHAGRHDLFDALTKATTKEQFQSVIAQIVPVVENMTADQWLAVHQELRNYGVEAA